MQASFVVKNFFVLFVTIIALGLFQTVFAFEADTEITPTTRAEAQAAIPNGDSKRVDAEINPLLDQFQETKTFIVVNQKGNSDY